MTHARKRYLGKRVPFRGYPSVRHLHDPPDPLPICHPCNGCPAVDLSGHRPFCFLPACMREDLEKSLFAKGETPHD